MRKESRMGFFHFTETPYKQIRERVAIKPLTGDAVQMLMIKMKPGEKTDHSHYHEQMGYILSGKVALTIAGETQVCGAGDGYHIPSGVQHGFEVLPGEDLEYIEIFCPPKEEHQM